MNNRLLIMIMLVFFAGSLSFAQNSTTEVKKEKSFNAKVVDLSETKYAGKSLNDILKKYKGKVIYLDFWASWCGPCKREMPYSQNIKKEFEGKDVAFVYMSTDKNVDKWRSAIDQLQISGDHYRASTEVRDQIVKRFNLQYIPRYVLINKEGQVADENAKRPSDPMVKSDIEKLLK